MLSTCGTYRYRLWRYWSWTGSAARFIMLNPSTADSSLDDPTIRKCVGFARRLGFSGIEVVNLFAYRATDPDDLKRANYPVGPENDLHIRAALSTATQAICAWGANAASPIVAHRAEQMRHMLDAMYVQPMALAITKSGQPSHPLMLSYDRKLRALPDILT